LYQSKKIFIARQIRFNRFFAKTYLQNLKDRMRQSYQPDELDLIKQDLRQTKEILQTLVQQQQISQRIPQSAGGQYMPAPEDNMRQSYAVSQYKNGGSPWMKESMSAQSIFFP
jgi:hypothetical protein